MALKFALPAIRNTSSEAPSYFHRLAIKEGTWGGLEIAYVFSPIFFSTSKWKICTFGPVGNPGTQSG